MSDNAAFHLCQNPLYPSRRIVLPPSLMHGENGRTFLCAVYGSSIPFEISVHVSVNVDDLKKEIISQESGLRGVPYSTLVLQKLSVPEPIEPEDSFWHRIRKRRDMETFAEELKNSREKMSSVFPQSELLEDHVHILVELPSNNSRSWLAAIHHKLWGEHEFFGQIFRTANLTEHDFKELQDLLDIENSGRNSDSYVAKGVLAKKSDFLRRKSEPLVTDFGGALVPRPVFDAMPPSSDIVGNDDVADDLDDDDLDDDDDDVMADGAMYIDTDCPHMRHLSNEATPIFPYTIRYMDLTVLNLQNKLRVPFLMLFRNEWGVMIDLYNERPFTGIRGSVVFTGQPGIGKTCLLYFVLILCMIRSQEFVFQDTYGKVFIINHAGVNTPENTQVVSDNEVLTLVDADIRSCEPIDYLLENSKHRILLTSSPRANQRRWLIQLVREYAVWVMEPWSRQEFVIASLFLQDADITLERLQKTSTICGNIPRACFEAAVSPAKVFDVIKEIQKAIRNTNNLHEVIHYNKDDDLSHRAFQIHPSPMSRSLGSCLLQPISAWAFMEMLDLLQKQSRDNAYKFYCSIKGYPDSSQLRGRIFETYFHEFLKESRTFVIKPLGQPDATKMEFTVNKDGRFTFGNMKTLSQQVESSVRSNTSGYFRPESAVFPSFDSFLYQPEISNFSPLIALQITTATSHDIKIKGLQEVQSSLNLRNTLLRRLRPANDKKMIILFVVPDDLEKDFGTQKITGKGSTKAWYKKTAQYVLGVPEKELFKFYKASETSKEK